MKLPTQNQYIFIQIFIILEKRIIIYLYYFYFNFFTEYLFLYFEHVYTAYVVQ